MSLKEDLSKNGSLLTEENLALLGAREDKVENRRRAGKSDDDNESVSELSKIDSNSNNAQVEFDLDGFCMSSDAETEKMEDETAGHVVLSQLASTGKSTSDNSGELALENFEANGEGEKTQEGDEIASHTEDAALQSPKASDSIQNIMKESPKPDTPRVVPGAVVKDQESEAIIDQELKDKPFIVEGTTDTMSLGAVQSDTQPVANSEARSNSIAPPHDETTAISEESVLPAELSPVLAPSLESSLPQQSNLMLEKSQDAAREGAELKSQPTKSEETSEGLPRAGADNLGVSNSEGGNVVDKAVVNDVHSQALGDRVEPESLKPELTLRQGLSSEAKITESDPLNPENSEVNNIYENVVSPVNGSLQILSKDAMESPAATLPKSPGDELTSAVEPTPKLSHGVSTETSKLDIDTPSVKRSLEEADRISNFKKPRAPPLESRKDGENDEDNDADEDEDEVEDEIPDKSDFNEPLESVAAKHVAKKNSAADVPEPQSPMEMESVRLSALKEITEIEHQFAELRQKLFESKLAKLQTEIQMCLEGSHPALQSYYQKIDSVRDFKLRRAYQRQRYELECIDKETQATRCSIHQDFQRKVSDVKHELLLNTTQRWYDINKERREMDVIVPDVNYHIPVKIDGKTLSCITGYAAPAQLRREGDPLSEDLQCEGIQVRFKNNPVDKLEVIVDRMRFNNELSDLEGLKRFFNGFPGAPSLNGLKDSEVYEDLQKMQRSI
ncbi:LAME_0B02454g1_1 [Lachancea meyersii CBS 8951]|uniref:LAME_0B02454g1_1 n=1 Tax=Lachancea meyersii CBS 8951 TaxID=1266667 RepID=A0A1G4ITS9_9SACH|nr:LAME_0B02454g1_1 [Lachancea meyersii CBS 8951]